MNGSERTAVAVLGTDRPRLVRLAVLIPLIAGRGTRLLEHVGTATIDLEPPEVIEAPDVTHLRYRLHA